MAELNKRLTAIGDRDAKNLLASSDYLIRKSIWSFGGDGWAYDIGFGGMDHVFASGRDVNILVLDTEVYSNTGGQASKSTFRGAVAKFAAGGKGGRKKDLGMIAMSYGDVFVGSISMGANPMHALRTIRAAESYRGTSLLIAFSHCIGWGIDMRQGMDVQKEAVACGYWPLWSFDPRQEAHPFQLASKKPVGTFKEFAMKEARFAMLARSKPDESTRLLALGQQDINARYHFYEQLAGVTGQQLRPKSAAATAARTNLLRRWKHERRSEHDLSRIETEESPDDFGLPADGGRRAAETAGAGGHRGGRLALALRGTDRIRGYRAGGSPGAW